MALEALSQALQGIGNQYFQKQMEAQTHARDLAERRADTQTQYDFYRGQASREQANRLALVKAEGDDRLHQATELAKLDAQQTLERAKTLPYAQQIGLAATLGITGADKMTPDQLSSAFEKASNDKAKRQMFNDETNKYWAAQQTQPAKYGSEFDVNNSLYNSTQAAMQRSKVSLGEVLNYQGGKQVIQVANQLAQELYNQKYGSLRGAEKEAALAELKLRPGASPLEVVNADMSLMPQFMTQMKQVAAHISDNDGRFKGAVMDALNAQEEAQYSMKVALSHGVDVYSPKESQPWYSQGKPAGFTDPSAGHNYFGNGAAGAAGSPGPSAPAAAPGGVVIPTIDPTTGKAAIASPASVPGAAPTPASPTGAPPWWSLPGMMRAAPAVQDAMLGGPIVRGVAGVGQSIDNATRYAVPVANTFLTGAPKPVPAQGVFSQLGSGVGDMASKFFSPGTWQPPTQYPLVQQYGGGMRPMTDQEKQAYEFKLQAEKTGGSGYFQGMTP